MQLRSTVNYEPKVNREFRDLTEYELSWISGGDGSCGAGDGAGGGDGGGDCSGGDCGASGCSEPATDSSDGNGSTFGALGAAFGGIGAAIAVANAAAPVVALGAIFGAVAAGIVAMGNTPSVSGDADVSGLGPSVDPMGNQTGGP